MEESTKPLLCTTFLLLYVFKRRDVRCYAFPWAFRRNRQEISTTNVPFNHYPLILSDLFEAKFP